MRRPTESPPPVKPDLSSRRIKGEKMDWITETRHYELITPLFGGGVEPEEADPVTTIRIPSIRGQLRFWWRACRGGVSNGDLKKMKEKEDKIWGAASTSDNPSPSFVDFNMEITNKGKEVDPLKKRSSGQAYAAFPLQTTNKRVRSGVSFTLTLSYPKDLQKEVKAALWVWETFGGIGGRTRRGFGALSCKSTSLPCNEVEESINKGLNQHLSQGRWPSNVPHLTTSSQKQVTKPMKNPTTAWEYLLRRLKVFRQNRNPGPGRSRWPEPDEIRRLTDQRSQTHSNELSQLDRFPRAAFGLPILFQFKDPGDPNRTNLQGIDADRQASPLILRPLSCSNGQSVGLAIILEGTPSPLEGLILKNAPGNPSVRADLTAAQARTILPLHGNPNVLAAFLDTL